MATRIRKTSASLRQARAPRLPGEDHSKDIDFTPQGTKARRDADRADTLRMIERAPWNRATDPIAGVIEHR